MSLMSKTWGQREVEGTTRARKSGLHSTSAGQLHGKVGAGAQRLLGQLTAQGCPPLLPLQGMEELEVEFLLEER